MIPISPSDVIKALVVINRMLEAHFEQDLRADTQYGRLLRDVDFFRRVLERYQNDCNSASNAPHRQALDQESQEMVGDFNQTLIECERLLSRYAGIGRTSPNLIQNAGWDFHVAPKIQRMNARIQAHTLKLNLLRDQLRTAHHNDMAAAMGRVEDRLIEVQRAIHPRSQRQTPVPDYLAGRFLHCLEVNAPFDMERHSMGYFQQAFEALVRHFELAKGHGPTCTLDQHISLYKARWLCNFLRKHPRFKDTLHYRGAIWSLDEKIEHELSGSDPDVYLEEDIRLAEEKMFWIWDDARAEEENDIEEHGEDSQRVLDVILTDGVTRLTVFRRGDEDFTIRTQNPRRPDRNGSTSFSIHSLQLDPAYALSITRSIAARTTMLYSTTSNSLKTLEFREPKDAFKMQQVFTNFQVVSDIPNAQWWYSASKPEKRHSRLQIWLYKKSKTLPPLDPPSSTYPLPPAPQLDRLSPLSRQSTSNSRMSSRTASSVFSMQSLEEQVTAVFSPSIASTDEKKGIVTLREPTPPAIVLFTYIRHNGRDYRAFLRLPLEYGIRIDLTACSCKDQTSCFHVVLSNKDHKGLNTSIIMEDDQGRDYNLTLLGALRSKETFRRIAREVQCQYLSFRFHDMNDKRKFLKDFDTVNTLRIRDATLYEDARTMSGWMGDHPKAQEIPIRNTLVGRTLSSASSLGRTLSSASSIPSPSSSVSSETRLPGVSLGERVYHPMAHELPLRNDLVGRTLSSVSSIPSPASPTFLESRLPRASLGEMIYESPGENIYEMPTTVY